MKLWTRSSDHGLGTSVLGLAMAVLFSSGCAVYTFHTGENLSIAPPPGGAALTCGAGTGSTSYTKDKRNRSVYARVENTGNCPLIVKQKIGGAETDTFRVAPKTITFTRYPGNKDFTLEFNCPAGTPAPATCGGTVALTPHRKGKPPGQSTYQLRTGDAIPNGTTCQTPARTLPTPITLRNQRKGSIKLEAEVTNTGQQQNTCPIFKLNITVGSKSTSISDTNGGEGKKEAIKLGKGKTMTFTVECDGNLRNNCDGNVRLVAKS